MSNRQGGSPRCRMPEDFDFAFAMREVPEHDLNPPASLILDEDIQLAPDLRVTSLNDEDRQAIRDAAAFRNRGCGEITLRSLLYGVVRDRTIHNTDDADGRLDLALALSRLVTPSTLGLDVWGKASRGIDGTLTRIEVGYGPLAYKGEGDKWWVWPAEWTQVRDLFSILDQGARASWLRLDSTFPKCVANAIRLFGHSALHGNAQLRYLLLVPALEGMVVPKQRRIGQITRVFRERLKKVCDEIRFPITENELSTIYQNRNDVAHAGLFQNPEPHVLLHCKKLEGMLRAILTRSIQDPSFARAFENNASLQNRWKVT